MAERVVIVSSFVPPHVGGVEQFVAWQAYRLRRSGHEVRIVTCALDGQDGHWRIPTQELPGGGLPWVWPLPGALRELREAAAWATRAFVHQYAHMLSFWFSLLAHRAGTPQRGFLHGEPVEMAPWRNPTAQYLRLTVPLMVRWAPPLALSRTAYEAFQGRLSRPVTRIPFPLRPLPARTAVEPPSDGPVRLVGAVRLSPEKAPLDIVAACDRLGAIDRRLDLYGDGPLRAELEAAARTRPWLQLHGARPWEEVIEAQRRAHAVVSASHTEGAQLGLLEPLGMGTPAVATAVGDARDYLPGPLAAMLTPPGRPDLLGAALERLLAGYDTWQPRFAAQAERLRAAHAEEATEAAMWAAFD